MAHVGGSQDTVDAGNFAPPESLRTRNPLPTPKQGPKKLTFPGSGVLKVVQDLLH